MRIPTSVSHRVRLVLAVSIGSCMTGTVAMAESGGEGLARGHLYSTAAVNRFCKEAQRVIANTSLESTNVIWDEFGVAGPPATGFISSDATPYTGAEQLPLTTQQVVTYANYPNSSKDYPQIISCKMKRYDALNAIYGPGTAAAGSSCKTIIEGVAMEVIASLTNSEQRQVVFDPDDEEVLEDPDTNAFNGPSWTNLALYDPAYADAQGVLHLVGRKLDVPVNFPAPVPPAKKGVTYCHVPAPEYIRALIAGQVQP